MYKIKRITFIEHPVLGNMTLDFCDKDGNAVDTVIIAGENGCGKSSVLNAIYGLIDYSASSETAIITDGQNDYTYLFERTSSVSSRTSIIDSRGNHLPDMDLSGIFSDVDIIFNSSPITSVTSLALDSPSKNKKSSNDLAKQVHQLLVDIQALDDATISKAMRDNPSLPFEEMGIELRMSRFTNAFSHIFCDIEYSHIENAGGHKAAIFKKGNALIPLDSLSSGEKQIVFRGCYLLKDVNAMKGAFVFIDEPEISLHPRWQMKIMDYYKGIFTNESGEQTSQIFVVTHSPFIIHNENRHNDKVIILARDEQGRIVVRDKNEYYKCDSIETVQDAFSIQLNSSEKPTVYLEGRTDEKYFNKTLEVYNLNVPFQFKWIGYISSNGEEANTGDGSLNKAAAFLISRKLLYKNICLYDCDKHKPFKEENNVITMSIPQFENDKGISIGIENALVFGAFDVEPYKRQKIEKDGYGIEKCIPDFQKMQCCEDICSLGDERQREILINLKSVIEDLVKLF